MKRFALYAAVVALMSMSAISCSSDNKGGNADGQKIEDVTNDKDVNPDETVIEPQATQDDAEVQPAQDDAATTEAEVKAESASENAAEATEAPAETKATGAGVVNLSNDDQFRPDTKVSKVTILDFNATWCVPCKKLAPAFKKAAAEYGDKAEFYSVDIDVNTKTAQAFGIQSVPTVVILSPKGAPQSFVGLGPFVDNNDQSSETIYKNISKKIDAVLK